MWGEMSLHQNKQPQQSCTKINKGTHTHPRRKCILKWYECHCALTVHVWANGSSVCPKHESVRKVCLKAMKAVQRAVQSSWVPDRLNLWLIHLVFNPRAKPRAQGKVGALKQAVYSLQTTAESFMRLRQSLCNSLFYAQPSIDIYSRMPKLRMSKLSKWSKLSQDVGCLRMLEARGASWTTSIQRQSSTNSCLAARLE